MSVVAGRIPAPLDSRSLLSYGVFGLPLAFLALPIYVHVPNLYAAHFGLPLAVVGTVLLAARIWDALIDPLMGWQADRLGQRRAAIALAMPLMGCGLVGLLDPPGASPGPLWLLGMLFVVYLGYSLAAVSYHAWGAELGTDAHERTRVTAVREGFALAGVVLASVLPGLLGPSLGEGLRQLAWVFVALLLATGALTLLLTPVAGVVARPTQGLAGMAAWLRARRFRRLLLVFAVSGIAAAIPASLVLFFIADVLQASPHSGLFLALYFVSAAAGLPGWVWLSRRHGKAHAWCAGMLLAVLVFGWAATLGPGEVAAFALICVLSGLALGADLALPPSILADLIAADEAPGAGLSFGIWNFVAKLNLALAAGVSLPVLGWLGYVPGTQTQAGIGALALLYAVVPAALKLVAACLLWRGRAELMKGRSEA